MRIEAASERQRREPSERFNNMRLLKVKPKMAEIKKKLLEDTPVLLRARPNIFLIVLIRSDLLQTRIFVVFFILKEQECK